MNLLRQTVVADELGVLRVVVPAGRPGLRADVIVTWTELPAEPDPALAAAAVAAELKARVDALATTFPAAQNFLVDLRALCARHRRLQLVTGRGLVLHLDYRVLSQIELGRSRCVGFSAPPAARGKTGTRDASGGEFANHLGTIVAELSGSDAPWATHDDATWWLTSDTPAGCFTAILAALTALVTGDKRG